MLNRLREARQNQSGFTLIELLIVIVILGVLAGIVVFAVSAFTNDGKATACRADIKNVEVAVEASKAKSTTGAWPASIAALVTDGYLKQEPSSTSYKIGYDAVTGKVTGKLGTGAASDPAC